MSDRVDTEAVREWARRVAARSFAYEDEDKRIAPIAVALCDELDRTREALRPFAAYADAMMDGLPAHVGVASISDSTKGDVTVTRGDFLAARAALAEGDTARPATMDTGLVEVRQVRCPTCGGNTPIRRLIPFESDDPEAPEWEDCPDPWHRPAPLVEGEQG